MFQVPNVIRSIFFMQSRELAVFAIYRHQQGYTATALDNLSVKLIGDLGSCGDKTAESTDPHGQEYKCQRTCDIFQMLAHSLTRRQHPDFSSIGSSCGDGQHWTRAMNAQVYVRICRETNWQWKMGYPSSLMPTVHLLLSISLTMELHGLANSRVLQLDEIVNLVRNKFI